MDRRVVHIIAGSASDSASMFGVTSVLDAIGVKHYCHIISAHRNPKELRDLCAQVMFSKTEKVAAFVAIAGWAAALPGAIGAEIGFVTPVIAVPLPGGPFANDSLLSVASMPPGCPVMVVPNEKNAAIAAAQIVAQSHPETEECLHVYLKGQREGKSAKIYYDPKTAATS